MAKLFVWDFYGVLEEGNELAVRDVSNAVLERAGYSQRLTLDDCNRLYGMKWYEYFADLLPDAPRTAHLELQAAAFAYSLANLWIIEQHIQPTPHAHEVLESIANVGHTNMIISNTHPDSLHFYLRVVDVERFFLNGNAHCVYAHNPDVMRNKADVLREYLPGKDFDGIVIVGDSPSDMELSRVAGGRRIHYTHPHLPRRECESDRKINDLRDVLQEI